MVWTVRIVAIVMLLGVVGCAHRSVYVSSEPSGALVYINGNEVGRTPMKWDFNLYGDYDVILRKDGYETLKTHRNIKTPLYGYPPFDLLAELFGVSDNYEWRFDLTAAGNAALDPQLLINRGEALKQDLQSSKYTRAPSTLPSQPTTRPAGGNP